MARIFYFTDTGNIHGVHPGPHEDNEKIILPKNVMWIDVPETPDKINWPQSNNEPGTEQTSMVVDGKLKAKTISATDKRARLTKMLRDHGLTVDDMKSILQGSDKNA